ncbi:MAG: GNAT family N-acetyltransferase [Actinomycetota bacterium]|nr:GNAT family N-acetyltransferase [Actinomycetota bacterium]
MDLDIRQLRRDELPTFFKTTGTAFGEELTDEDVSRFTKLTEVERCICALDGDEMVGTAAAISFGMTVPGRAVPAAGVTAVGVLPTHRRRGALTKMMRYQLDDIHERGEPVAILWASEANIYRRFGYGLASMQAMIDIERDRAVFRRAIAPVGRARLVDIEQAAKVFPEIYDRVRIGTPGMVTRSPLWWREHTLHDLRQNHGGGPPMWRAVVEIEGRAEAYALYRVHQAWDQGSPTGFLQVLEVMATAPEAMQEVWRFLFGVDLVTRVKADWLQADHPLVLMVTEPSRLRFRLQDALFLRLVDVGRALEARAFRSEDSLTFEVRDAFCPWNEGRWHLETHAEGATAIRTSSQADLVLDVEDLGSVYLGAFTFEHLLMSSRVEEATPGAIRRADAMFISERAPWCVELF